MKRRSERTKQEGRGGHGSSRKEAVFLKLRFLFSRYCFGVCCGRKWEVMEDILSKEQMILH